MVFGPLQLFVIGFVNPRLDGSVLGALEEASDAGLIRVVDLLGIYKDEEGNVLAAEASDLTEDEAISYGAWVGALIGLGAGGEAGAEMGAIVGGVSALDEYEYGLDEEALATIADDIPAGGAGLMVVVEHKWMIPLRDAMRAQGGILIAQDFLNPESLIAFGAEAALED
ncbi:MAG: DUF6325 family protein [Acidimicrobiia bacterium]|nr:DUF6325 family protein [Acidimicrobiia bacterium]